MLRYPFTIHFLNKKMEKCNNGKNILPLFLSLSSIVAYSIIILRYINFCVPSYLWLNIFLCGDSESDANE